MKDQEISDLLKIKEEIESTSDVVLQNKLETIMLHIYLKHVNDVDHAAGMVSKALDYIKKTLTGEGLEKNG